MHYDYEIDLVNKPNYKRKSSSIVGVADVVVVFVGTEHNLNAMHYDEIDLVNKPNYKRKSSSIVADVVVVFVGTEIGFN